MRRQRWVVSRLIPVVGAGVPGVLEIRSVHTRSVVTGGGNWGEINQELLPIYRETLHNR